MCIYCNFLKKSFCKFSKIFRGPGGSAPRTPTRPTPKKVPPNRSPGDAAVLPNYLRIWRTTVSLCKNILHFHFNVQFPSPIRPPVHGTILIKLHARQFPNHQFPFSFISHFFPPIFCSLHVGLFCPHGRHLLPALSSSKSRSEQVGCD